MSDEKLLSHITNVSIAIKREYIEKAFTNLPVNIDYCDIENYIEISPHNTIRFQHVHDYLSQLNYFSLKGQIIPAPLSALEHGLYLLHYLKFKPSLQESLHENLDKRIQAISDDYLLTIGFKDGHIEFFNYDVNDTDFFRMKTIGKFPYYFLIDSLKNIIEKHGSLLDEPMGLKIEKDLLNHKDMLGWKLQEREESTIFDIKTYGLSPFFSEKNLRDFCFVNDYAEIRINFNPNID